MLHTNNLKNVDFIKVDIDGDDFDVLLSIENELRERDWLGALLEVNFIGGSRPNENTFPNVDIYMRKNGFTLCDLSIRKYSKAALPHPYINSEPGQNYGGRPRQGDALYLRDPIDDAGKPIPGYCLEHIIKLCCLNALFNQHDAIAELAQAFADQLNEFMNLELLLNVLTKRIAQGKYKGYSYDELMVAFQNDAELFTRTGKWKAATVSFIAVDYLHQGLAGI